VKKLPVENKILIKSVNIEKVKADDSVKINES